MSKDISKILDGWPFQQDDVVVRIIKGDDGRDRLQLRVDLGLLQMEMDGRPDGLRPEGCRSWLEYYQQKQRAHDAANPDSAPFELQDEDCSRLWREGVQHYHRYLGFWHLKLYELCARDTRRNLELFAFVRGHARNERSKLQFDQWRPYVIMMHSRAVATPMIEAGRSAEALDAIESGIDAIRDFLDEYDQSQHAEECKELVNLEKWREEVSMQQEQAERAEPAGGAAAILRRKLQEAIAAEQFEEAARLRDEIRRIADGS